MRLTLEAMQEHSTVAALVMEGCWVLTGLAFEPEALGVLLELKAAEAVIEMMRSFPDDPEVQLAGSTLLRELCDKPAGRAAFIELGVPVLSDALRDHVTDLRILNIGMSLLFEISNTRAGLRSIARHGCILYSHNALQAHQVSVVLQRRGLALLRNIALDREGLAIMAHLGTAESLLSGMRVHDRDLTVQRIGLEAFRALLESDEAPAAAVPLEEEECLRLVLKALGTFRGDLEVQRLGLDCCLLLLARKGGGGSASQQCAEEASRSLAWFPDDADIVFSALKVLGGVCPEEAEASVIATVAKAKQLGTFESECSWL